MPPTVFIIGTSHAYQFGEGAVFGETACSTEKAILFRGLLISLCEQYKIRGIGEELSVDALSEMNRAESIPRIVAAELSLPHRYCDPNQSERVNLGIRDENYISAIGQMSRKPPGEIEQEIYIERLKREPYWLKQLNHLSAWPTLFVCGAWHVPSFSFLLRESGVLSNVVVEDWGT